MTVIGTDVRLAWSRAHGIKRYRVTLDDASGFVTPTVVRDVMGTTVRFAWDEQAIVPGTTYYVRVEPKRLQTTFRVKPPHQWKDPVIDAGYIKAAWEQAGRDWMAKYSGVEWVAPRNDWRLVPDWSDAPHPAENAYYVEYSALAALNLADASHDAGILDELAKFYNVYLTRFTTLGQARAMASDQFDVSDLEGRGKTSTRILLAAPPRGTKTGLSEYELCTSQFLYPAARLLRMITRLSNSEWTGGMRQFVADYPGLLLHEHLLRNLYDIKQWHALLSCAGCSKVELWENAAAPHSQLLPPSKRMFLDTDLWYGATAAELLGAHANNPDEVEITREDESRLKRALLANVAFLQSKRTLYSDTRTFSGEIVQSASYFNGDLDGHPDNAFSGYAGIEPPGPGDKATKNGISWDVSHIHRLPIYFRALYDNRKATELNFPTTADVQLIVRQLLYRVLQKDVELPMFNNFFDGTDGWYRVSYHSDFGGYPPARECQTGLVDNCLVPGSVQGWGMLSLLSGELSELEQSLIRLASASEPIRVAFRNRYFAYDGQTYSNVDTSGNTQYPVLLFWIAANASGISSQDVQ